MSEQRPSDFDWKKWEALAKEMEREEETCEQQHAQAAEPSGDGSRERPALNPEDVVDTTARQHQDTPESAGHHTLEPKTSSSTRHNDINVDDNGNFNASSNTLGEPTSEVLDSPISGYPAPVSFERGTIVSPTNTHQEAAASPDAGRSSGDSNKSPSSLGYFPHPPSWEEDRRNQAEQTDTAELPVSQHYLLLERRRCGCIKTEHRGNRRWRLCGSPTCETKDLQLSPAPASSSQSTAHLLPITSPDRPTSDERQDNARMGAPSSPENSVALREQAASPLRRPTSSVGNELNSDPIFISTVSSDPPNIPTADSSSSANSPDSFAIGPLPQVQVNDVPVKALSSTIPDNASTAEPLPDLEQYPSPDSRAVADLPRVELYDAPMPESPPKAAANLWQHSLQDESTRGGLPRQAQGTPSHQTTSEADSSLIEYYDSILHEIVQYNDPDAITPAPPLPQGHVAPPVPPAGATPAPTEDQAPFLAVEEAVHKGPLRPPRPQIVPFTSKQIQEANASLAAVPAVATASATNPSSVFNTPLLDAPPASSTVPSTRLNTPATAAHPSSSFNSAPTTADAEGGKPSGWGAFGGGPSPSGFSGAENAPPVRLLPELEAAASPLTLPAEPRFPDYGGVDVGPDAGPMTKFTSRGESQAVGADAAGYVRTELQSYPRAMERVARRDVVVGGAGGGSGSGGDGGGDGAGDHRPVGSGNRADGAGDGDAAVSPPTRRPPSRRERVVRKVSGAFGGVRDAVRGCFERGRDRDREREEEGEGEWEEELRPRGRSRERRLW